MSKASRIDLIDSIMREGKILSHTYSAGRLLSCKVEAFGKIWLLTKMNTKRPHLEIVSKQ